MPLIQENLRAGGRQRAAGRSGHACRLAGALVNVAAILGKRQRVGYQTRMMIYGPGGYRFGDFLRVGLPLDAICWVTSCLVIPLIWPF